MNDLRAADERRAGLVAVQMSGITKTFPAVVADRDVDLTCYRGEVHCLLGENGAGKSTLMHVLSGLHRPDAGSIAIDGQEVEFGGPREAIDLGVGMVYQHPTLVPTFTALDNLLLVGGGAFRLDRKAARERARRLAAGLGVEIDPEATVGKLPLGRQQQVEIVRVLWSGASIVILDEPTALLTPAEVAELDRVMASLKAEGLAVVFITHRLPEAIRSGDRVTVLRRGEVAGRLTPEDLQRLSRTEAEARILDMMFGTDAARLARSGGLDSDETRSRTARLLPHEPVLEVESLFVKPRHQETGVRDVTFSVREGEIFGIAGVDGNGQRELAEALAGQRRAARGTIRFAGADVTHDDVAARHRSGVGYVTDDRLGEGMVSSLPVSLNLLLKRIGDPPFWGRTRRLSSQEVDRAADELIRQFDIRAPDGETPGGALSGGNIQRMLLARELSFHPRLVVYNKPTYGLDARATVDIRERIRSLSADSGVAAVLISSELDELLDLSDRIAVMSGGELRGIVENVGPDVQERVGSLMVGGGDR